MSDLLELYEQAPARTEPGDLRLALMPMLVDLTRALGYDRAIVALYDEGRGALRGFLGLNVPEQIAEALDVPLELSQDPKVITLTTGEPQRVNDVRTDERLAEHNRGLLLEMGITSFAVAPLRTGAEGADDGSRPMRWRGRELPASGVVILSRDAPISDADVESLLPYANQAGVALARARDVEILRGSSEAHAIEKEWLRWMIDSVADPVVLTDANNEIILQNRRAELLFRAGQGDSAGKSHAVTMNNFLFTAALSGWNLEQGDRAQSRELTLVDPIEGSDLIFEVITVAAMNYRLGERGMVSVLKNVSDLRQVTEELTENIQRVQSADAEIRLERDRLDLVLRSVPNPIIVMDNENQIISMNQAATRLFRTNTKGVTLSRQDQITVANDTRFTTFLAQLALESAQRRTGEIVLTDPDTEERLEMAVTSTEIRDDTGSVLATVSVMQDIGRLRELERRRVEQLLFDSEKLAATGRLAASIAHEINNPLEAIQNSLYLLVNKTSPDDPNAKFLQIAMKETERMSRILRQMLGFYRPAAEMGPTQVNALIEEAESLVAKHLRQKGVTVENELDAALPAIKASADQLKQVILNLLYNAGDSMPNGGKITVSTQTYRDAGSEFLRSDSILIQIVDTGTGIAEEHMPHIFEPFFSTKTTGKGTGLGLWVSFGIVQSHGGTLSVKSRLGRGTTFSITLPIGGPPPDAR